MSTSVIFARGLMAELSRRNLDHEALLRACNIDRTRVSCWREMLNMREVALLTRTAVELTRDPGLGLSMGARAPLSMLQLYGCLMLAQPTWREAAGVLQCYAGLLGDHFFWRLSHQGDQSALSFTLEARAGDVARVGVDYALTVAARIYRHFAPNKLPLHSIQLQCARPDYGDRYAQVFQCSVEFAHYRNALIFPRHSLDLVQSHADAFSDATLRRAADKILEEQRVVTDVARRLGEMLLDQRDPSNIRPERVARQLGLNARSLRRRLQKEGTTFTSVVDSLRCRIACDALLRDDATVDSTARLLGYSEASAFHRAFKRWTGRTPRQFVLAAPTAVPAS